MHRNDLRFPGMQSNQIDVQAQVTAVIKLYVKRFYQDLLQKSLSHSGFKCRQLRALLRLLPLPSALIPDDPDPDAPDLDDPASPSLQEQALSFGMRLWNAPAQEYPLSWNICGRLTL
ncbi:hypothetical protein PR003_g13466 [Phytophthora rubi]|uniref:Uncharacterized protein n=1 Tax=Phytophthora rubi TaxID=129364 RepID=A0A6A4EX98_9STRA|nr:hypothetical protein PR003_g13466 [Phytophthora rubi]